MSAESLALLFAHIERQGGGGAVMARTFEKLAPVDARVALHAAKIVAGAPAIPTWPCDEAGCAREIRANYDGARKPLVAVCSQAPPACMPVELAFEEVAQQEIDLEALLTFVCVLLEATADPKALATIRTSRPFGGAVPPTLLAAARRPVRDVFWAGSPRDTDLASFCILRERVARGTLLLVPTAKYVAADLVARYIRGAHVELLSLADALAVRDGALVLAPPDAAPPTAPAAPSPPSALLAAAHGIAAALGATKWEQIRITEVDGQTVRIAAGGKSVLRTFVELGFVDNRRTEVVTPVIGWSVFLLMCKKGSFMPSAYGDLGKAYAAKKGIETVRRALRASFGLKENPMRGYSAKTGWVPRFLVGEPGGRRSEAKLPPRT
jgi:hypothetical protein